MSIKGFVHFTVSLQLARELENIGNDINIATYRLLFLRVNYHTCRFNFKNSPLSVLLRFFDLYFPVKLNAPYKLNS